MPGDGMARMIQMLSVLSEVQGRRRAQDLAENQFEESKRQFAAQMGFNEKSAEYKKFTDLMDAYAKSSTESRNALNEIVQQMGFKPELAQAMIHFGASAPESLDMLRTQAANAGVASMTPDQRTAMNREAAFGATTGMNQGQLSQSALLSALAGNGNPTAQYGADMLGAMAQGYAQRTATGQTADQAAMSAYLLRNPGLIAQAAGISAGNISPQQAAQNALQSRSIDVQQGQVSADFYRTNAQLITNAQDVAAKIATAKRGGLGLTPDQLSQTANVMQNIITAAGKEKSQTNRNYLQSIYNVLAGELGIGGQVQQNGQMQRPGFMEQHNPFSVPGMPQAQPQPVPGGQPTQLPTGAPQFGVPTSPMFSTPQPQFLNPNVNPLSFMVRP